MDNRPLRAVSAVRLYIKLQFQNNFYLVEEGALDEKMLSAINNTLATIRGTPGFAMYWSLRRELFYPDYQAFVEQLMFETEGLPNQSYRLSNSDEALSYYRLLADFLREHLTMH